MKRIRQLRLILLLATGLALALAWSLPQADGKREAPTMVTAAADNGQPLSGVKEGPMLMLTFDDGPNPTTTQELAIGLADRGAHGTFFLLGQRAETYPELTAMLAETGQQIGSHGWDHSAPFPTLSDAALSAQIDDTVNAIQTITGQVPAYVRPPYGSIDIATAEKIPYPLMLWTIDPRDWEVQNVDFVRDYIVNNAVDGGVVILHDAFPTTVQAALEAVDILSAQGWVFPTLEQYYAAIGFTPQPGVVYRGDQLDYMYSR